jgi:transcription initiation factor TFIID TATA-box-binding protein
VTTARKFVFDELRDLGINAAASPEIEFQNIVSRGDLGHTLNLNTIAISLRLESGEHES